MRARFGVRGTPLFDYRGAQVVFKSDGRTYLGDVRTVYRDEAGELWRARVVYFNGEEWPFAPPLADLEILQRREA